MKRIKLFGLVLTLMLASQVILTAQDSTYMANEYAKAQALYQKGQRYNDALIQKQALIELSILTPRDTAVLRTLAELYYNNNQFVSSALVAQDMNAIDPTNILALEIQALSFESLRLYDKAVENYEKLWLQSENNQVLYQISFLQYSLKRFPEAMNNLTILDTKVSDEMIQLSKSDGNIQEVKFKAAMENLRGLIALEQGNTEEAQKYFQSALSISPDFEAPQMSLEGMK